MKRALIVDDSKSARVVLSRVLEKLELAVDTTESAESALHYLRDNRPDVIFMDQVMSGMDGLQAVQAIKNDPSTASIPIMMYTSQDGELFAGEARAMGAAGVLPKLMAPSDISKVLDQLEILRDPREVRITNLQPAQPEPALDAARTEPAAETPPVAAESAAAADAAAAPPALAAATPLSAVELREAVAPLLREQGTDLRRFVVAALESFSGRVVGDVTQQIEAAANRAVAAAQAAVEAAAAAVPAPVAAPPPPPEPEPVVERSPRAWMATAAGALLLAAGCATFAWQQHGALAAVRGEADARTRELISARRDLDAARAAAVPLADTGERVLVPYGEIPLSGDRLAALSKLLADLEARGTAARVTVTTVAGEFCLTGNPGEGYSPAPGEMPANHCDVVGNPYDEALKPEQREPQAATAMAASSLARPTNPVEIKFAHLGRQQTPTGYPVAADVSAAQWNAAATNHNYVEFTVETRHPSP